MRQNPAWGGAWASASAADLQVGEEMRQNPAWGGAWASASAADLQVGEEMRQNPAWGGAWASASAADLQVGEEMRQNPAWGGAWPYCTLCGKWSDEQHRKSAGHEKKMAWNGPSAPEPPTPEPQRDATEAALSADKLAEFLASKGEPGFEAFECFKSEPLHSVSRAGALLRRCCLVLQVPQALRKRASHCGGLAPDGTLGPVGFRDTPMVADPGNAVHGSVSRRLLCECPAPERSANCPWALGTLASLNDKDAGDVPKAILAAANSASDRELGRARTWEGLRGGAVPFLVAVARWELR
jgi:hypothetical protein